MKRLPIVLWLIADEPADEAGRVAPGALERGAPPRRSAERCCGAAARRAASSSFQALQVGDERARGRRAAAVVAGMLTPGLSVLRIGDPARELVRRRSAACRRRASSGRRRGVRSGALRAAGDRALRSRGTSRRCCRRKTSRPRRAVASAGSARGLALRAPPRPRTALGRIGDHLERHEGVLVAAELGALAAIACRAGRRGTASSPCGRGSGPSCRRGSAPRSCGSRRRRCSVQRRPAGRPARAARWRS